MGPSSTLITTTHDGSDTYRPVITFADKVTLYGDSSPSQSTDIYAVETIPRYILWSFGTYIFPVVVFCSKKNLVT
jgi:hypothetical protein